MTTIEALRERADPIIRDRCRGCLLAGAAGDALGAAVEFMTLRQIRERFGADGLTDFAEAYGRIGAITDDTQMTLFTAEGVLRAWVRWLSRGIIHVPNVVARAYVRWLRTQQITAPSAQAGGDGWLVAQPELYALRAPGATCLDALRAFADGGGLNADNDSKGCGGVMRVAPIGLLWAATRQPPTTAYTGASAFRVGVEVAAITHGHPSGQLPAGLLASIIRDILDGSSLREATERALVTLTDIDGHEETLRILRRAVDLADASPDPHAIPAELGLGWVAEEALAIAVYAALVAPDLERGIVLAVNHDGDSDSTGAIAGNLLGAVHGTSAIPAHWLARLELREVIEQLADDLAAASFWNLDDIAEMTLISRRYPGN